MWSTFDTVKNERNIAERGLSFELVAELAWETAIAREDVRRDYGERRVRVLAHLGNRLHMAVVTYRDGAVHVISFRKANKREITAYENEKR
jgi:uncharacterized DUF497 family protein